MQTDIRDYIRSQYKQTLQDLKLAPDEDTKFKCLRELHRLSDLAAEKIGFDFLEELEAEV